MAGLSHHFGPKYVTGFVKRSTKVPGRRGRRPYLSGGDELATPNLRKRVLRPAEENLGLAMIY